MKRLNKNIVYIDSVYESEGTPYSSPGLILFVQYKDDPRDCAVQVLIPTLEDSLETWKKLSKEIK